MTSVDITEPWNTRAAMCLLVHQVQPGLSSTLSVLKRGRGQLSLPRVINAPCGCAR